MEKSNLYCNMI